MESESTEIDIVRDDNPDQHGTDDFIEFDSMINLRPGQGNRSRAVDDPAVRAEIEAFVGTLVV